MSCGLLCCRYNDIGGDESMYPATQHCQCQCWQSFFAVNVRKSHAMHAHCFLWYEVVPDVT